MNLKNEMKYMQKIGKLVKEASVPLNEETALKQQTLRVMDNANVCMMIATDDDFKRILRRFIENELFNPEYNKSPELIYDSTDLVAKCRFSALYLKQIFDIMSVNDCGGIDVTIKKDYPATFEIEGLKVILAPRIET